MSGSFAFALCQPGSERVLKEELARKRPDLHPAFARPGLVTFKSDAPLDDNLRIDAVFARRSGLSLGNATAADAVDRVRDWVLDGMPLHVATRPDQEGDVESAVATLTAAYPTLRAGAAAKPGERVLDVVVAGDEPWLLGVHRHQDPDCPWPGGLWPVERPAEAPSRAYLKMEEALRWTRAPVQAGQQVLDIGAAPGGAALAMLRRGLRVCAIDPRPLDEALLQGPHGAGLKHLRAPVGAVKRTDLPEEVHWLVLDMGIAPQRALRSLQRFFPPYKKSLLGALLTLKLNELSFAAEIPLFLDRLKSFGLRDLRATQLPSNRQEVFVYGVTARGRRAAP